MNMNPEYEDDEEEAVDFGKYRPIRIRGAEKERKKERREWDDE